MANKKEMGLWRILIWEYKMMRKGILKNESAKLNISKSSFSINKILSVNKKLLIHLFLIAGAFIMIIPFLWMLSTSLKTQNEVFRYPPNWIPAIPQWKNYLEIYKYFPFLRYTLNTLKIALIVTVGQLFTCSLAGYSFARIKFPGKNFLFLIYLASLMIPFFTIIIPQFAIMKYLGWIDTHTALIVPSLANAFGTFFFRQFYLTFPSELEDAARIDGCNPFQIYYKIFLPLSKPAVASLSVFTFMGVWNDFLWPLVILSSKHKKTLTIGLAYLKGQHAIDWPRLMAGSVLSLLPIILMFLFLQKYFVKGIALSGTKM